MSSAIQRLAAQLNRLERGVRDLATTPQLAYSSIEDGGSIDSNADDGKTMAQFGGQFDGTFVAATLVGPVPPVPSLPIVAAGAGTLTIRWDGLFTNALNAPMDFSRVELHASTTSGFSADSADTLLGTIESPRGGEAVFSLPVALHYVRLVTRSLAGNASAASVQASGTPESVVTDAELAVINENVTTAQATADGKNKVIFSTLAASGTAYAVGDLWFQKSGTVIIGQWEFVAGAWAARTLGNAVIANLDAAKITVGQIQASQLSATAVDGKTITGATVRTAVPGLNVERWELKSAPSNTLQGFTGRSSESAPGAIRVFYDVPWGALVSSISSPVNDIDTGLARITLSKQTGFTGNGQIDLFSDVVNVNSILSVGGQATFYDNVEFRDSITALKKMQRGSRALAIVGSGGFNSASVTFPTPFDTPPTVVVETGSGRLTTSISVAPTAYGFTAGINNWSGANSAATTMHWIAIA